MARRPPRTVAGAALAAAVCAVAAGALAGSVAAAVAPQGVQGALLRTDPELPVIGARVTVELRVAGGEAPASARLRLVSPTGKALPGTTLRRAGSTLLRGTLHFADDGLWTLLVRDRGIDARAEVLVLQPAATVPGPKGKGAAAVAGGGGLALLPAR